MAADERDFQDKTEAGSRRPRCVPIEDVEGQLDRIVDDGAAGRETIVMEDGAPYMKFVPITRAGS